MSVRRLQAALSTRKANHLSILQPTFKFVAPGKTSNKNSNGGDKGQEHIHMPQRFSLFAEL
jgi:hypothetical protein